MITPIIFSLFLLFTLLCSPLVHSIKPSTTTTSVAKSPKIEVNLAAQNNCCDGTCCDSVLEDCCPDPQSGGVCCILASSYCCKPIAARPSRCCPRWTICCEGGQEGCCSPEDLKQPKSKASNDLTASSSSSTTFSSPKVKASDTAYGLFDEANWDGSDTIYGLTIDTATASKTQQPVSGFDDFGEATRVFLFDPSRILFYLLRANFSKPGFDGTEPITLYTIDPRQGSTISLLVKGATGLVTGLEYNKKLKLIQFATYSWVNNQQVGYDFFVIDPAGDGTAKKVSSHTFGSSGDDWVGWFRDVSDDGSIVYRLGFKDAVNEIGFGIGLTDISNIQVKTQWIDNFTIPSQFGYYVSLNVNGNDFYSLAEDSSQSLNLIKWNLTAPATTIANLGDAYQPRLYGPIAEALNSDASMYYAMVVHDGIVPIETDRWAISVVNLTSGYAVTTPVYPWMIAGTDGLSGFGIADPSLI